MPLLFLPVYFNFFTEITEQNLAKISDNTRPLQKHLLPEFVGKIFTRPSYQH